MGRHGPQPQRRLIRRRVAELAQRGRRVATWTGSGHRGEEGWRRRGVFSHLRGSFGLSGAFRPTYVRGVRSLCSAPRSRCGHSYIVTPIRIPQPTYKYNVPTCLTEDMSLVGLSSHSHAVAAERIRMRPFRPRRLIRARARACILRSTS